MRTGGVLYEAVAHYVVQKTTEVPGKNYRHRPFLFNRPCNLMKAFRVAELIPPAFVCNHCPAYKNRRVL